MAYQKLTQKKIDAILVDVQAGMKVIMLQAKHGTSLQTIYKVPILRKYLFGRSKRSRENQMKETVSLVRKGGLQREIAKKLGISVVTVRRHLRIAEKKGLISQEERVKLGKAANLKMLTELWKNKKG
jgi:DNA-binding MarR family transcriptional regulator